MLAIGRCKQDISWLANHMDGWIWHQSAFNTLPDVIDHWRKSADQASFRPYGYATFFDLDDDPNAPLKVGPRTWPLTSSHYDVQRRRCCRSLQNMYFRTSLPTRNLMPEGVGCARHYRHLVRAVAGPVAAVQPAADQQPAGGWRYHLRDAAAVVWANPRATVFTSVHFRRSSLCCVWSPQSHWPHRLPRMVAALLAGAGQGPGQLERLKLSR